MINPVTIEMGGGVFELWECVECVEVWYVDTLDEDSLICPFCGETVEREFDP